MPAGADVEAAAPKVRGGNPPGHRTLEHVPKKLLAFFDSDMVQLFDFARVLIDQMILFDRDAL
jgi:hypothetical protein